MTLDEQVIALRTTVRQLLGHVKELQKRVEALEQAPEWVRIGHTGCSWDWQCPLCKQTQRDGHADDCIRGESTDFLTGSIDGLDGELRVRFLTPQEHAWAKLQRAGEATRTAEPEWGDGRA